MSHDPKDIPKIINLLDEHAFVVGSRYMFVAKMIRQFLDFIKLFWQRID